MKSPRHGSLMHMQAVSHSLCLTAAASISGSAIVLIRLEVDEVISNLRRLKYYLFASSTFNTLIITLHEAKKDE